MGVNRVRRAVRQIEKAVSRFRLDGCPACRDRQGRIVWIGEDEIPEPCQACGEVPDYFFIEVVAAQMAEEECEL